MTIDKINSSFVPNIDIFQKDITGVKNTDNSSESVSGLQNFSNVLKQSLDAINTKQVESDNAIQSFVQGDDVEISDVMLATKEAELSLKYAVEIRNKIVDAYKEISQMQI